MYGSARAVGHVESSPVRSPRLPRSPRLGHRRANSGSGGGAGGKTLSMENIQSLNAAYATSGPMYLSDHEGVGSTATYPKGTMTLGRATSRAMYGGRVTAMGSSPNIASVGLPHADLLSYSDLGSLSMLHPHHHQGVPSALLRQAVRGSGGELLEMQAQFREMQRENEMLRRELDLKDSKLGSSTNSIKSFWSPELKKERIMRKEEAARTSILKEQMRVTHEENQHLQMTIQALQDELRTQRDLNHLLQQESGNRSGSEHFTTIELTEENFRRLQAEHDRQAKELFLLRKTLEEMELRIETQKQTLGARDESIKKLLEMLQSKGLPPGPGRASEEEEQERARRIAEAEAQLGHLEVILDQKEKENIHLREELHRRNQLHQDPSKTKALQTIIEMKDTKIASLERNIRDLEDEIQMLKANGLLNTEDREEEIKQMEVYKNHSKFMKTKVETKNVLMKIIDQLKQELSKKESELLALQTKLETLNNQNSDCKQHIEVLKESLTAKEQRAAILQTEVDALRLRLEEKESFLNKKTKQLQDLTEEKGTLAGEIRDMKDMLEVKERKINVLQKKIENLQEQLRDKDKQLGNLKDRVKSLQTDSSNTDTALATLEEALSEKERIIERLKDQREREDRERLEEVESYKKENKDLKEKVNSLQIELTEKESSLIDLKEHASSLASSGLKKDSKLKSLEIAIEQKKEECSKLETQLQKAHEVEHQSGPRGNPEYVDRVKLLEKEVNYYKDEASKAQTEVERLLDILREVETEKNDKDKKIAELERQGGKDQTKKGPNIKLGPQGDKKGLGQDLRKDGSIDEIFIDDTWTRQELDATKQRLSSTQQSLQERDTHLTNMRQERRKQLEEILDMKQQALLAAISEKDANIALLELSASNKKKTQEEVLGLKRDRDKLMLQLKQHVSTAAQCQGNFSLHRRWLPGNVNQNEKYSCTRQQANFFISSAGLSRTCMATLQLQFWHFSQMLCLDLLHESELFSHFWGKLKSQFIPNWSRSRYAFSVAICKSFSNIPITVFCTQLTANPFSVKAK
uniref:ELKS/RAB6-interacting/CAST family member 2 n=1 Tax=Amphiprion ocellaris TaxID=80972 RepID=A0AAQ6ADS7_AMPOC